MICKFCSKISIVGDLAGSVGSIAAGNGVLVGYWLVF